MGKYERKKKKKFPKFFLFICLLFLLAYLVIFVMPRVLYTMNGDLDSESNPENTAPQVQETGTPPAEEDMNPTSESQSTMQETQSKVEFPCDLDAGKIQIDSLFQFSGVNPDAQNQNATDVSAIVISNASGQYLREATIIATLATGRELCFKVTDLPAGSNAMIFSVDNTPLLETDVCTAITIETFFEEMPVFNNIEVSVDGMMVTIANTSSVNAEGIAIYYHDVFGDKYFGGKTYIHNIEHLSAGESITIAAEETLLGMIEVVYVAVHN